VCLIWDGSHVRFSTTKGRRKYRNLRADPRIAISVTDPENPWRYLEIRGRAELSDDGDRSFINQIARKYMGQDEYPFDRPGDERFQYLNAGKRSAVVDLASAEGRELALAAAARADLVVESFGPGGLAARGLAFEALRARNPRLSLVSISPWGQSGPWASRPA